MIPAAFGYSRPKTLDQALREIRNGSKVIAGGQSLLPLLKLRLAAVDRLVDIGSVPGLKGIRRLDDGRMAVGALTTYRELLESPAAEYGLLRDALPMIADVQVRNRGTVGGSIAHADPASDLPACLLALDAEIVARSPSGERTIRAAEFFQGAFATALAENEILTEIRLPGPRDDAGSAYRKLKQRASGYAIVGVAAVVVRGADGTIAEARIGITGVGDVAYRATAVEKALVGSDGSARAIGAAAVLATEGRVVNADIHADAEYRTAMAAVYTRRAIEGALARIDG
ncbi:MAG TPA: xanthine dehydrogenase family protein subunit M [Candidatus Limnocylindrales bacterium]|jgi:carbon-monoxide dehydrogenase medium subunit|nr:xanthine dehydrogenase family protein subunit M [Candidatus Limnocylindrales bacterium]